MQNLKPAFAVILITACSLVGCSSCNVASKPVESTSSAMAVVFVLDRSGSMSVPLAGGNRTQLEFTSDAMMAALQSLQSTDIMGVVVYDSEAEWVVVPQAINVLDDLLPKIREIEPGGGTNIYAGLKQAYDGLAVLAKDQVTRKQIILLTDGNSTPPAGGSYIQLVTDMVAADMTLSTVGIGDGHDARLLSQLAQLGGGAFYALDTPEKFAMLPGVLIDEVASFHKSDRSVDLPQ